jgi:hypothetical protein
VSDPPLPTPFWCLIANIVATRRYGPGGTEIRRGLNIFTGGAKVYLAGRFHCADELIVIGVSRRPHRLVNAVVAARFLTNWRVRTVYRSAVLVALAAADVGLDLPYRYRQERNIDPEAVLDRAGEDYRAWLIHWAATLTKISERQAAEADDRFNRAAQDDTGAH